jgi:hypothetical protein
MTGPVSEAVGFKADGVTSGPRNPDCSQSGVRTIPASFQHLNVIARAIRKFLAQALV